MEVIKDIYHYQSFNFIWGGKIIIVRFNRKRDNTNLYDMVSKKEGIKEM